MTPDLKYCQEKALQNKYLIDIKKGFKGVLVGAGIKHKNIGALPKMRIMNVLAKLLSL